MSGPGTSFAGSVGPVPRLQAGQSSPPFWLPAVGVDSGVPTWNMKIKIDILGLYEKNPVIHLHYQTLYIF